MHHFHAPRLNAVENFTMFIILVSLSVLFFSIFILPLLFPFHIRPLFFTSVRILQMPTPRLTAEEQSRRAERLPASVARRRAAHPPEVKSSKRPISLIQRVGAVLASSPTRLVLPKSTLPPLSASAPQNSIDSIPLTWSGARRRQSPLTPLLGFYESNLQFMPCSPFP